MIENGHTFDTMRDWDLLAAANADRHECGQGVEEMSFREREAAGLWTATAMIMSSDGRNRSRTGGGDNRTNYAGANWQWKLEDWQTRRRR